MSNFRRYFENGLSPIPVKEKAKRPAINAWERFCIEKPSDELIDQWDEGSYNIGLACGPASGILVLDIDTDDKDFLNRFPPSPVRRRGKKGEARFFRVPQNCVDQVRSASLPNLDILWIGRQIVVPPSIHPEGMPYEWITPDTMFDFSVLDLPEIDVNFLNSLYQYSRENPLKTTGRNNKLKDIVCSMYGRGVTDDNSIVKEIYDFDIQYNKPRLFTDQKENNRAASEQDAMMNALKFVTSVKMSLIKSGAIKLSLESNEGIAIDITDEKIAEIKKAAFTPKPYPESRGIMAEFQKLCALKSAGNQDATSLGGAISLMSILASNKFVTKCRGLTTCPNTYVINLGYSSFGKEMAQSIINELLYDTNLLGSGNYKSAASIIMNLNKQQERLDVIDECSTILSAMGSKEGYAAQIVELLSELFTKGSTKYAGQSSLTNGERFGAAWNPHISILGSTTPKGFRSSVNKEVAAKGLLPRMLLFFQHDVGDYKGRKDRSDADKVFDRLKSMTDRFIALDKKIHPSFDQSPNLTAKHQGDDNEDLSMGYRYEHRVVEMTHEAHEMWLDYEHECHDKKRLDPEGFESAFIGRFAELTAKLALLDALSQGQSEIDVSNIAWGKAVVESQWHNAKPLFEEAHAESLIESEIIKILNFIKKNGIVKKNELKRKFQRVDARIYNQAISTLLETNQIKEFQQSTPDQRGARPTLYQAI